MINLSREEALNLFIEKIILHAHKKTSRIMDAYLAEPQREETTSWIAAREWFNSLESAHQEHIRFLIKEASRTALFGCMTILDGVSGGTPLKDNNLSDFALYIQAYHNTEDWNANRFSYQIRINHDYGEELHDVFLDETRID